MKTEEERQFFRRRRQINELEKKIQEQKLRIKNGFRSQDFLAELEERQRKLLKANGEAVFKEEKEIYGDNLILKKEDATDLYIKNYHPNLNSLGANQMNENNEELRGHKINEISFEDKVERINRKFAFLEDNLAKAFTEEITGERIGIDEWGREWAAKELSDCKKSILSKKLDIIRTGEDVRNYEKFLEEANQILNDTYRQIFLGPGRMRSRKCSGCIYSRLNLPEDLELLAYRGK